MENFEHLLNEPMKVILGVAMTFLTTCGAVAVADLTNVFVTMVPGRDVLLTDDDAALALLLLLVDVMTVGSVDGMGLPSFVCSFNT